MQPKITHISLKQLNIQELQSHLPPGMTHLTIDKAALGPQPPNTFIVGTIQDIFQKTIFKGIVKKRMTLREVLLDETEGKQLDIFSYDMYAHELEKSLGQDYNHIWIVFTGVHLDKYMGFQANKEGWCNLRISLRPNAVSQSGDKSQPQVWLVKKTREVQETFVSNDLASQFSLPQRPPSVPTSSKGQFRSNINSRSNKKTNYVTINNCKDNKRQDVMVVIKNINKPPTKTKKGTYHTTIIVVDSSCLEVEARREDMLVHVFINDKKPSGEPLEDLPGGVKKGDILRLHDMMGENYSGKIHGKVYSALQVVKFSSDTNEPVSPTSAHTDYMLSECDHEQVLKLRDWWEKVSSQFDEQQIQEQRVDTVNKNINEHHNVMAPSGAPGLNDSYLEEFNLVQITKEMTFNLICQVLQVRRISACDNEMVILHVRDGTYTKVPTQQIDLQNATQELLSQTDYCTDAGSGIVAINVWVKLEDAKQIEPGGFYRLKKVEAIQHVGETDSPFQYFELIMNNESCSITRLLENHNEVRKIERRLEGKINDENFGIGITSSFAKIASDLFKDDFAPENNPFVTQHIKSPGKAKSNRINSQPRIVPTKVAPILPTFQQGSEGLPSHTTSLDHAMGNIISQSSQKNREAFNVSGNNDVGEAEDVEVVSGPSRITAEDRMDISAFPLDIPCSTQLSKARQEISRSIHETSAQQPSNCDIIIPAQRPPQTNMETPNHELLDCDLVAAAQQSPVANACFGESSSSVYAAVAEDIGLPPLTPSADSTSAFRSIQPESGSIPGATTSKDGGIDNKKTELDKDLPELKFENLQNTQTELGSYQTDVVIKEVYCMSSKPSEEAKELAVSDWVWGVCIECEECCLQSWEIREHYSPQDIVKGELSCQKCSLIPLRGSNKSRRKKNILRACMRLVLLICNPEDEEKTLLVSLAGDHAHHFFGSKPQFSWILNETDATAEEISQRLSTLLDSNSRVKLGISKYILSTGIIKFQITNTKLKL